MSNGPQIPETTPADDWREGLYRVLLLGVSGGGLFIAFALGIFIATNVEFSPKDWATTYVFFGGVLLLNFAGRLSRLTRTRLLAGCLLGIAWSSTLVIGVDTGPVLICFMAVLVSGLLLSPLTTGLALVTSAAVLGVAAENPSAVEVPGLLSGSAFAGTTFAGVLLIRYVVNRLEHQLEQRSHDLKRLRDETAQRAKAEESLQAVQRTLEEAQRFEAIGRVAGAVAHEFNNLLQVIVAWTDALEMTPDADEQKEMMQEIRRATLEAGEVTGDLLSVARRGAQRREVVQLDQRLPTWTAGWKRIVPESIQLNVEVEPVRACFVHEGLIQQGILNLIRNAADLSVGSTRIDVKLSPSKDEAFIEVSVTDDGCGMNDEERARVFEPFFTTKGARGTGLGLSIVRGQIEQLGGAVSLNSTVGQGTVVALRLPVTELPAGTREPETPSEVTVPSSDEHVLLVEDDDSLRRASELMLEQHDISFQSCADGDEAMAILDDDQQFFLLCIDAHMPGASTLSVIQKFKAKKESGRVLVCSGNVQDASLLEFLDEHQIEVLTKPYSAKQFMDAVSTLQSA